MPFETNVFINCPFDKEYKFLLRPLIFTVVYFGLEPKISQTRSSSTVRVNQIKKHIAESKYSIHDLCRSKAIKKNDLPRFNMPFELGLDIGCVEYGPKKAKSKNILILEAERYHYQKVLSDIAGQDIESHNNDPKTLIRKVRNWFSIVDESNEFHGAHEIWMAFNEFQNELVIKLNATGFLEDEIEEMPVGDYIKFSKAWISRFTG